MKYTPKPTDKKMRLIYIALFLITVACLSSPVKGIASTILSSVALVTLVSASFLVIKFELTLYTYILLDRENTIDFYVEKRSGQKGSYVCYFPLSDAKEFVKFEKGTKKLLREKYKKIRFYNYAKNMFSGAKYCIVFENGSQFDAVLFEPDDTFINFLNGKSAKRNVEE
ncbi:MAG: hypothetical protein IJY41_05125 [Clostridia bacterium]|nr:hypothetical protein [Clostridia bacterium]